MPNWFHGLDLKTIALAAASCWILCRRVFRVFADLEDNISSHVKETISIWLKSAGDYATGKILLFNIACFHSHLFGDRQFSLKCLRRSIGLSSLSFFLMSLPIVAWKLFIIYKYGVFPVPLYYHTVEVSGYNIIVISIISLITIFTCVVFPLDFIGVYLTRILTAHVGNDAGLKGGLLTFILDTFTKTVIFPLIATFWGVPILLIVDKTFEYFTRIDLMKMAHANLTIFQLLTLYIRKAPASAIIHTWFEFISSLYPYVIPSVILCSLWAWLYFFGLHIVRSAVCLFNVKEHPVRSVGLVASPILAIIYGLYWIALGPSQRFLYAYSIDSLEVIYGKDLGRAITDYSEAIRLDPTSPFAFTSRGTAYLAEGLAKGDLKLADGDLKNAIADFSEAIRLDTYFAVAFNNRGYAYAHLREPNYDKVIDDYSKAIQFDPTDAVSHYNRGSAYAHLREANYDKAIDDFSEVIRLAPTLAVFFNDRGDAYVGKEDYGSAIDDYSKAIRLEPKYPLAFDNTPMPPSEITTAPLLTTTRQSGSALKPLFPSSTAATPMPPSRTTTTPSPTTARRFGSRLMLLSPL